jgi:uncharacterized protein
MPKTILLILAVLFAYWYFVGRKRVAGKSRRHAAAVAENMVACARCGLRIPESDAIPAAGQSYCCDEHRQLGAS